MMVPPTPPPPEVVLTEEAGAGGLCIKWQSVGPMATGYMLELCEGSSMATERFVRQAPSQTVGTLELCVGGLISGRSYAACVRSLSQCGHESAPSAWSKWQSIPAEMLPRVPGIPLHLPPVNEQHPVQLPPSPHSMLRKVEESQLEKDVKKVGMAGVLLPPEVTGHEEGMLVLN